MINSISYEYTDMMINKECAIRFNLEFTKYIQLYYSYDNYTVSKGRTNNKAEERRYSCNTLKMIQCECINIDQIFPFQ